MQFETHQEQITLLHILSKQGNSVARDLPPTGSEANITIFVYVYWI